MVCLFFREFAFLTECAVVCVVKLFGFYFCNCEIHEVEENLL